MVKFTIEQPAQLGLTGTPGGVKQKSLLHPVAGSILVVDDERMNLAILSRLLEQHGYEATRASSGIDAVELLSQKKFDLVLLDLVMPDLDGAGVLRLIRRDFDQFQLPVVMLTATDDHKLTISMFELGANDYITKPFDPEVMLARVSIHLRLKTALAAVRQSEERYALAARATNDGLWDWDLISDTVYYSPRWNRIVGLEEVEVVGSREIWTRRIHPDDVMRVESYLARYLSGEEAHFDTEFRLIHEDGTHRWVLCRGIGVKDSTGRVRRMAGSMTDITGGKMADVLTGLPNRLLFTERVKRCLEAYRRDSSRRSAVLYLDLDNFKYINDTFGHEAGDLVLKNAARRLESVIRIDEAVAARFGGDEFAILLEDIQDVAIPLIVAQRVREAIAQPLLFRGREVFTQVSIGIAVIDSEMNEVDDFLRNADIAMYDAKSNGKCLTRVFSPEMKARSEARFRMESELRQAMVRQEFLLHYQPIIDLQSGRLVGVESLLRWQHPVQGIVMPPDFIPLAEETGIIVPLGAWVLENACRQVAEWHSLFPSLSCLGMHINISGKQLQQEEFAGQVLEIVRRNGVPESCINIELTESMIMTSPERGRQILRELQEQGIRISVDDFGTGFSSLASLHQLPLDTLKIDRQFIDRLGTADHENAIVRTILSLASNFSLEVVAEGVASQNQCDHLKQLGCQYAQGYHISVPLSTDEMTEFLKKEIAAGALTA